MRTHLALLQPLVAEFPRWLDYFVDHGPFTRPEQLTCHLKAIALRRQHLSAAAASNDSDFVKVLHDTLRAWGVGSRGSNLLPLAEFGPRLLSVSATLKPLEPLRIDADDLDVERHADVLRFLSEAAGRQVLHGVDQVGRGCGRGGRASRRRARRPAGARAILKTKGGTACPDVHSFC